MPGSKLWAKVDKRLGVPVNALILVTLIQMLLGLINIGSSSAFIAFISVGVQALALSYAIPILISLLTKRKDVNQAKWTMGRLVGPVVNTIALVWIAFELILFSMPTALPVTPVSMNYSSVVLVGFGMIAAVWYGIHSRKGKQCHKTVRELQKADLLAQRTKAHLLQRGFKEPVEVVRGGETRAMWRGSDKACERSQVS